ncbi:MAG: YqeG family HAD IIIA-type phosphatase [Bacillota bacterium]|jgi:HAD superfamily phosphatase (TIGR01668 family)
MSIFRPNYLADDLFDLPLETLKKKGIVHLLFDVDNTIVPYNSQEIPEETVRWFHETSAKGFRLCILSNNSGERVAPVAEKLGIDYVARAKKPLQNGAKRAVALFNAPKETIALIGDQLLTDMACGNIAGFTTIVVKPINPDELWITKWHRNYEKLLYRLMGIRR